MANVTSTQITEEGPRNLVVKFTGVLDTADISINPILALTDTHNNEKIATLAGFGIQNARWSISGPLILQLAWVSTTPQQALEMSTFGHIKAEPYGGWNPNQGAAGYTGAFRLTSTGWAGTVIYTVVLELQKLYTK